jgi:hypothetical protein
MVVDDLYPSAQDAFGRCDPATIFRAITDAVVCISNQSLIDPEIGEMNICVCEGCITLPEDVGTVLEVNSGGWPTLIRNQFFQYHPGGTGSQACTPCGRADELGAVCTFRDPSGPVQLIAEVESAADNGKLLRVFAKTNGKKVYSVGTDGRLEEGFLVPTVFGYAQPNPEIGTIDEIYRIRKDLTNGFVRLNAINADGTPHTGIGYYGPNETDPSYRRLRVAAKNWARIKYKKKDLIVRSRSDWINIDHFEAMLLMIRAVKFRRDGRFDLADASEIQSIRLINAQAEAQTPGGINPVKVIYSDFPVGEHDTLIY